MSWYFFGGFSAYAIEPSGAGGEPLRVLGHPRVVRRGLQGQVERDLHALLAGRRDEVVEVLERAQLRVDRVVPALVGADRPGRSDVLGAGHQRVVPALAVDLADRVDRRQVDHVEAELGDLRQPAGRVLERAVPGRGAVRRRSPRPPSAGTARTRPRTAPSSGPPRPCSGASGSAARGPGAPSSSAVTSAVSAGPTRWARSRPVSRSASAAASSTPRRSAGTLRSARCISRAPSSRSLARSSGP